MLHSFNVNYYYAHVHTSLNIQIKTKIKMGGWTRMGDDVYNYLKQNKIKILPSTTESFLL
jgi:hypothetical protein